MGSVPEGKPRRLSGIPARSPPRPTMFVPMDAFAEAVEAARQRLSRDENRNVSVQELARRAGKAAGGQALSVLPPGAHTQRVPGATKAPRS